MIISTGWPYARAISSFLVPLGLEIGNTPLGSVQAESTEGGPDLQFTSAWPLYGTSDWSSLCSIELGEQEFTVIATRTVGGGRLVVIGDAFFLQTEKLEGDGFYNEETIDFLNALLGGGNTP